MKVLITGSKGYIGRYLVEYLTNVGYGVLNYPTDLNSVNSLPMCDIIVNCAAKKRHGCVNCTEPKEITIDSLIYSNVTTCQSLARLAKVPIIHLSSVASYDMNRAYGVTKLLGEHIMRECGAKIIRLPKVVDGRTDENDIVIGLVNVGEMIDEAIKNTRQL